MALLDGRSEFLASTTLATELVPQRRAETISNDTERVYLDWYARKIPVPVFRHAQGARRWYRHNPSIVGTTFPRTSTLESVINLRDMGIICNNSDRGYLRYFHELVAKDTMQDKGIPAFVATISDKFRVVPEVWDVRVKTRPEERSAVFWVLVYMPKYDHKLMKRLVRIQLESMAIASDYGWITEYMFVPLPHVDPDQIDINQRPSDYLV